MEYIATVCSHFGAIKLKKILDKYNIVSKLSPVPRSLSSSCGTCVLYNFNKFYPEEKIIDDIDKIFQITENQNYKILYTKV